MRELLIGKAAAVGCAALLATCANAETISLDGSWEFRFDEGMTYREAAADFVATDRMAVPGCYDMMPKWLCKRGTGRYRRTFTLEKPVANAWLVIDGMGLTGHFRMDGKDLGVHPYPYARLEIPTGPLAADEHVLFAALDNRFDWEYQKLARPYYDFYCFGGFYHGVSLVTDNRKLFVRTRDYATGMVEVEVVGEGKGEGEGARTLVFDGTNAVKAVFRNGRAKVKVPNFRLWSPEEPNLHMVEVDGVKTRFGIRTVEARDRKIWLNGKPIYLKGFNRHESHPTFGAATDEKLMALDLQNLKSLGANFVRGCHYQQAQKFLDLCDETGVLVWEESLGWGNGSHHEIAACELTNETFRAQQVHEMREMVRASINHPCIILTGFLNEFASQTEPGKSLAAELVKTIKEEDSGHLTTFACSHTWDDISHAVTDVVAFNSYPGWFDSNGVGDDANFRRLIRKDIGATYGRFRKLYPEKPIIVSEMGVCAIYGAHDPAAAQWTEEFQAGALAAIIDEVFSYDDICGLAIWHFADARSYHRSGSAIRGKPFAENLAGVYDGFRRAKLSAKTVRERFSRKPGTPSRTSVR